MEPVSFAVGVAGLAGLFSVCVDAIEKYDSYKDFGIESRALVAQFEADKLLFRKWGKRVGIDGVKLENEHSKDFYDPETFQSVQRILSSIHELALSAESIQGSLHFLPKLGSKASHGDDGQLILYQGDKQPSSKRKGAAWAFRKKAKFISEVQQFGALVQRLYSVVPLDGWRGIIEARTGPDGDVERHGFRAGYTGSEHVLLKIEKQLEHEARKEVIAWLGAPMTANHYQNCIRKRLSGTCEWILSSDKFAHWASPHFPSETWKTLWINGPPGYGKTMLCAKIVEHLSPLSPVAYFFFSSESEHRGDLLVVIRSWISQIVSQEEEAFQVAYEKWEEQDNPTATESIVFDIFRAIARQTPSRTFVVDGLDECTWAERSWKAHGCNSVVEFFEAVQEATMSTATRIMIVSRDVPDIRNGYISTMADSGVKSPPEYRISPIDVYSDALLFSRSIIDKKLPNKAESQRHGLSARMAERSDGMFLWMKMLEDQLRGGLNSKRLEDIINQAPTAIEHLYDRDWDRIYKLAEKDRDRAMSILRWVAFALRPLTILEITEALLIVDDDHCDDLLIHELPDAIDAEYIRSEILDLCGSFLETRKPVDNDILHSSTIHLAHFSVKQYILCKLPGDGLLVGNERLRVLNEAAEHNRLAKLCLRYLSLQSIWQQPFELFNCPPERPFLGYAAKSWLEHVDENDSSYSTIAALVRTFLSESNPVWNTWRDWVARPPSKSITMQESDSPEDGAVQRPQPLYYASAFGLYDTVAYMISKTDAPVNSKDFRNRTALFAAGLRGHVHVAKFLLANNADITIANDQGWTPLNMAAKGGYVDMVKLLLDNGADSKVATNTGWTPLYTAANGGYFNVVKLLLDSGADVAATTKLGWTPVKTAAFTGHVDVVKLLLDHGADLSVGNNDGRTPLYGAAYNGHIDVIRLLLDNGADAEIASTTGWTPLNSAANRGHADVVKLLLENGADLTVTNNDGWTPLNSAADMGHADVVKLLLENGADLTVTSNDGWTPLNSAAESGYVDVVQLLLDNGADITVPNNDGWTPLNSAADSGHVDVAKLLLENGANIDARNKDGWTPLKSAAAGCHVDVVKLLLENKADTTVADEDGWTPLISAADNGYVNIVKLLLDSGADITATNRAGWTPLNSAAESGHVDVVKLLLDNGADLRIASNGGWTPLDAAADQGHVNVVKLLLDNGADVHPDDDGRTALSFAAENGHEAVVQLLLSKNLGNVEDITGRPALFWAARNGEDKVVRLMLGQNGVDTNHKDRYGSTALSIAIRHSQTNVVKLLLCTADVDFDSGDHFGRSLSWWSRRSGNAEIQKLLLDYAKERGIQVRDSAACAEAIVVSGDETLGWCDVCTLDIPETSVGYRCGVCYDGYFYICSECYELGGKCLEEGHQLVQRKIEDGPSQGDGRDQTTSDRAVPTPQEEITGAQTGPEIALQQS